MRPWLEAMRGIMRRDAILFVSYRTQLVSQFLGPLFTIAVFYYISRLLTAKTFTSPGGYFGFVIVGLVIVQILTLSLGLMPGNVRQELVSGTIERFLVSAHGPVNGIIGTMLFPLCNAFFSGILTLAMAALFFGLPLAATSFLAIPVALLGVIAFMPFALFLVALVMAFKQAASATPVHRRRASRSWVGCTSRSRCCPGRSAGCPKCSRSPPPPTCCATCWWTRR